MSSGTVGDPALGGEPEDWRAGLALQGEWGSVVAAHDWSSTPLGPILEWPAELRTAVSICVGASIPMTLWWGPDLVVIPNLASVDVFGEARFRAALGRPAAMVWSDAAPRIQAEISELEATGRPFFVEDSLAPYDRDVPAQESYLTYSYTPVTDAAGRMLGVLCVFVETTSQVLAKRRGRIMADLGHRLTTADTVEAALTVTMEALATNPEDHPAGAVLEPKGLTGGAAVLARFGTFGEDGWSDLLRARFETKAVAHAATGPILDPPSTVAGWHAYPLHTADEASPALVLVLAHHRQRPFEAGLQQYFELAASVLTAAITALQQRARVNAERDRARSADAAWRAAVLHAMHDPLVIFGSDGVVVELNQAFTDLFGYSLTDNPIRPPYPWWPTKEEDPDGLIEITNLHNSLLAEPRDMETEVCFYTRGRRRVWVELLETFVANSHDGSTLHVRTLHNVTRDKDAQRRRVAAAHLSAEFADVDELETLLGFAEHAYELLFDGAATIQLDLGEQFHFGNGRKLATEELEPAVRIGLAGQRNPDTKHPRPGILLTPRTTTATARAWIQFPQPRRIGADEMIIADLLAQAFAGAVDRLNLLSEAATKLHHLEQALESHRLIGQAVGILVERHRILPAHAFDRLKAASQTRNQKLRDIAVQVIDTGAEPDQT